MENLNDFLKLIFKLVLMVVSCITIFLLPQKERSRYKSFRDLTTLLFIDYYLIFSS